MGDKRSFKEVLRRRFNWKAAGGWGLLVYSLVRGTWTMVGHISQIQWVVETFSVMAPYLNSAVDWFWSYGWLITLPVGFVWLYKADQPPPSQYSLSELRTRETLKEMLPHFEPGDKKLLEDIYREGSTTINKRLNRRIRYDRPLLEYEAIERLGEARPDEEVVRVNPVVEDLIGEFFNESEGSS